MSQRVAVELPDELALRARRVAEAGNRRLEDAVIEWIRQAVAGLEIEALPDDELHRVAWPGITSRLWPIARPEKAERARVSREQTDEQESKAGQERDQDLDHDHDYD